MAPFLLIDVARDETLARRAAGGDERAFTALVARYQPRLERYCRSILRNDEDGSDAAQNTLTRALIALRTSGGPDRAVSPWLFRIAHNESISLLRRRRDEVALDESVPVSGVGLHEQAELRADVAALLDGVAALPPRARHALLLREFAGLDHRAIGQVLGISPGAARQAVYEARTSLKGARDASRPRRLVLGLPVVGSLWSWVASLGTAGEVASGGAVLGGKLAAAAAVIATSAPVVVHHAATPDRPAAAAEASVSAAPKTRAATTSPASVPAAPPTARAAVVSVASAATATTSIAATVRTKTTTPKPARTQKATPRRAGPRVDDPEPAERRRDDDWTEPPAEPRQDHERWTAAAPVAQTGPTRAAQAAAPPTRQDSNPSMRRGWRPQPTQPQPTEPQPQPDPAPTPAPTQTTPEPAPEPTATTTVETPVVDPPPTE